MRPASVVSTNTLKVEFALLLLGQVNLAEIGGFKDGDRR